MSNDDWKRHAACRRDDASERLRLNQAFFAAVPEIAEEVYQLCAGCPVRVVCLNYALDNGLRYGVFGGLNARERARLRDDQEEMNNEY